MLSFLLIISCCAAAQQADIAKLAAQATVQKYPDAESVLLYDAENITCQKDGTSVGTDEFYYKILNESGRKKLSTIPLHCNTNYDSASFLECAILRNGKKININIAKHTTVTTSSSQMSSNIYDPEIKVTTLAVPQLETGDVLYVKVERKTVKPLIHGEWSNIFQFESDVPILRYDVTIDMPSELPLRRRIIKNEIKGTVKTFPVEHKNGRIIYKYQAKDVPQAIPEDNMPKLYTCCQRLLVGTADSWQDISKWYYNLCRPGMDAVSEEMKKKVATLVRNAKNDDEKIQRIFKYVSQNIRYTGVTAEQKAPGFEPHDVKDTFKQKHGVCRDKAALLASMLELAGLKAYPALFMAGTPKDSEVPNGYFNHAVVCVDKGNFEYVLMDPTDENTRTLFPEYLSNQSFLAARPEGDILRRSAVVPAEKNKMKIATDAIIDAQGAMSGTCRIEFNGISDLIYRSSFSRMTPAKRLEFWQGKVRSALPGARVLNLKIAPENIRDTSKQMVVEFSFKTENTVPDTRSTAVLTVPKFGAQFGILNWILPETSLESRRFPIECDASCRVDEETVLKLPPQFEICGVPKSQSGKNRHFSWSNEYSAADNMIKYIGNTTLDSVEIKTAEYKAFRKELASCSAADRQLPAIRKRYAGYSPDQYRKMFPDADAVLLESDGQLKLSDRYTCTGVERRKILILNYAGVKKYSELIVSYFPSRESVDVSASVTQADGKSVRLEDHQTRVMDAAWTSDLKNVPPEKIKVCALPGVAVNSIIEYTVIRKGKSLYPVSGCAVIQEHIPVLKWNFSIDAPEKLKLYTSGVPVGVRYERQHNSNRIVRSWSSSNINALKREYSQSRLRYFAPHISYSTVDRKEFADKFESMLEDKVKGRNLEVKKACFANMNINDDTLSKVRHIRDFVVRNVRTAALTVDKIPANSLRTPDEVYSGSVATGVERALLMASLFRDAGINYRFYLASSRPFHSHAYRDSRFFEPDFDTVLLYVPEVNGYFNSASEYAQIGYTSYSGMLGMNLANARMSAITSNSDALDRIRKSYTVKINKNGSALIDVTEYFYGRYYEDINRKLSEMTPELRKRHFLRKAYALNKSAVLHGKYSYDFTGKRAVVKYSLVIPNFAHHAGDYLVYELPGHELLRSKSAVFGTDRSTPYTRSISDDITLDWRILSPDGYSHYISGMRSSETGHSKFAEVTDRRSSTAQEANITIRLSLPVAFVKPNDFDCLILVQNALGSSKSRYGMMKKR